MDEQTALARVQQGQVEAMEFFVLRYHLRAVRAAYLITLDRSLAEDIVQAAFLNAYEQLRKTQVKAFGPWFLRSVINAAIKAARRHNKQHSLELPLKGQELALADILPAAGPGPDVLAEQAELREAIAQALARLPAAQRAAIVQRYYLGMSEAEMAQSLDCAPGTIKWRLHAARQELRRLLASWAGKEHEEPISGQ